MTVDKILKEIKNRIDYLEEKKTKLDITEMSIETRKKKKEIYENELDRLYELQK